MVYILRSTVTNRKPFGYRCSIRKATKEYLQTLCAWIAQNRWLDAFSLKLLTSKDWKQEGIEGRLEKRTKGVFAPPGGKFLICFLDDVNMPKKSVVRPLLQLKIIKRLRFCHWY